MYIFYFVSIFFQIRVCPNLCVLFYLVLQKMENLDDLFVLSEDGQAERRRLIDEHFDMAEKEATKKLQCAYNDLLESYVTVCDEYAALKKEMAAKDCLYQGLLDEQQQREMQLKRRSTVLREMPPDDDDDNDEIETRRRRRKPVQGANWQQRQRQPMSRRSVDEEEAGPSTRPGPEWMPEPEELEVPSSPEPPPVPQFTCAKCSVQFDDFINFRKHITYKCEPAFQCSACDKCFSTANILGNHIQTKH